MNYYEQKQVQRKERYEALAIANKAKADMQYRRGRDALDAIPFGQPIASNSRARADRAYRERARASIARSFETGKKAEYYEQRAEAVGTAGISSDDPDAIAKLKEKLTKLVTRHEEYRAYNVRARKEGGEKIPGYVFSNSNANINSTKKRIEQLEANANRVAAAPITGNGWVLTEDVEDNRIRFAFDGKPDEATRAVLKGRGFKWSPLRGAWVRQLNNAGRYAAKMVCQQLQTVIN